MRVLFKQRIFLKADLMDTCTVKMMMKLIAIKKE